MHAPKGSCRGKINRLAAELPDGLAIDFFVSSARRSGKCGMLPARAKNGSVREEFMAEMRHQGFGLGPETLDVLRGVFHEAWAEFEARFPAGMDSTAESSLRRTLASRILRAAEGGESDLHVLKQRALAGF
jgi:hypothetical protein